MIDRFLLRIVIELRGGGLAAGGGRGAEGEGAGGQTEIRIRNDDQ